MTELPEFERPPVVEVSAGVQFRPIFGMRGLVLAPLRERWLDLYPRIEERPELPRSVEGAPTIAPEIQFNVVSLPTVRQWFLNEEGTNLVQIQPDRLIVNWRAGDSSAKYPRYAYMRDTFSSRFDDLDSFVSEQGLGGIEVNQTELSYINAIEAEGDNTGHIGKFLKGWRGTHGHHLGEPEQSRMTLTFLIPGMGQPPVRMYAEVNPGYRASGELVLFFNLTVRGNPGSKDLAGSLKFMDEAHQHIVRSFEELTKESMHQLWGRRA